MDAISSEWLSFTFRKVPDYVTIDVFYKALFLISYDYMFFTKVEHFPVPFFLTKKEPKSQDETIACAQAKPHRVSSGQPASPKNNCLHNLYCCNA
jgi:hypothetical protein